MPNIIEGVHLTLEGKTEEIHLFNPETLTELFEELVTALGMRIIHGPTVKDVEIEVKKLTGESFKDEGGTSAYCMISTSHISIHCWPLRKQCMLDVFSCKYFDVKVAQNIVEAKLAITSSRVQIIDRHFNF